MAMRGRKVLCGIGAAATLALLIEIAGVRTPARAAQPPMKTAGEVFKNVQVLKDIPANQLIPSMEFISSSLGVRCGFCHVEGAFYKDTKRPKLTARHMIEMELAINKANFGGRTEVTCYTCHRGMTHPVGVPVIGKESASSAPAGEGNSEEMHGAAMPTADQILAKFAQAAGGEGAIQKVSSAVAKGTVTGPGGQQSPVEIFSKAPDKYRRVSHTPKGEIVVVYDGHNAWMESPGQQPREITGGELAAIKLDADMDLPANLKQTFSRFRVIRPEQIDGHEAYVLLGFNPGQAPVRLSFDAQSGMLVRIETFTPTPLGSNPMQLDYSDFRSPGGVGTPFRETISQPGFSYTIQFSQVQQNAPVSESEFAKPPAPAEAAH